MKNFLAGILATTMILEMGAVPVAMAMEKQNTALVKPSYQEGDFNDLETLETGEIFTSTLSETEEVATISDFDVVSGTCGDNLTWELVESTGVLTISGEGEMDNYSSIGSLDAPWYGYRYSITSVEIGFGVTSISPEAFEEYKYLSSVTISNSVKSIGNDAFQSCTSLTSIEIPNSVTSIGNSAFEYCSNLSSVNIGNSVTSIGESAFSWCSNLSSVNIPNSVTSINVNTFFNCSSLASITIPNSVTSIGKSAFYSCDSLTTVTIPSSVASIEGGAFSYCDELSTIYIYSSNLSMDNYAFHENENLISFVVSESCNSHSSVDGVLFNKNKSTIFQYPSAKPETSYTIPSSVTNINDSAFRYCDNLKFITIPNSVTNIGTYAFSKCSNLMSLTIPSSVTSIGDSVSSNVFGSGCEKLASITVDVNNKVFYSLDGVLFSEEKEELVYYPPAKSDRYYTIPDNVKYIGYSAFEGSENLISVVIPESVTSIGQGAFGDCTNLTRVSLTNSIKSINLGAFDYCDSLSDIYYLGSPSEWANIKIDYYHNYVLYIVKIHYYSAGPNETFDMITLDKKNISLLVGKTSTLSVVEDTIGDGVYWYTDDKSVATVIGGKVTAIGYGTTTIRALSKNNSNVYAECEVNVTEALTDFDLWGLSRLVYQGLSNYTDKSVASYIEKLKPDLGKYSENLSNYFRDDLGNFKILEISYESDNGFYAASFEDCNNGIVIAFRGSNSEMFDGFFDLSTDWETNCTYVTSDVLDSQFYEALNFYRETKKKYPDKSITLTGHSLGGALASFVSIMEDEKAVTFNSSTGYILEDSYGAFVNYIDNFKGVDGWDFCNYYNESDHIIGDTSNDWYKTYELENNKLGTSDLKSHGIDSIIVYSSNSVSSLTTTLSRDISYLNKTWNRTVNIRDLPTLTDSELKFSDLDMKKSMLNEGKYEVYLTNSTNAKKTLDANSVWNAIIYSSGNWSLTGTNEVVYVGGDDIFILKNKDTAYGKSGDDRYIIHETGKFDIDIADSSGDDVIYFSRYSLEELDVTPSGDYYYITTVDGGIVNVNRQKSNEQPDMTVQDKNGDCDTLSNMANVKTKSIFTSVQDYFSTTEITGKNLLISVLDENNITLGTYTSEMTEVSVNEFAYVYPTENGLEFELMNGGKYLRIEGGTDISAIFYNMTENNDVLMQELTVNLAGHESAIINTYLDKSENFYYLKSDETTTTITTTDYVKMSSLSSSESTVELKTGESENFSLTVAPSNTAFAHVEFSWKSLTDDPDNATSIAQVTKEEDGTYTITGTSSGTDTLIFSSLDGSDLTEEIFVTISQDSAPTITMTSDNKAYISGWSEHEVAISGSKSGYDTTIYMISGESSLTDVAPTISQNGITTISLYGLDSISGKTTAITTVEVWIDNEVPEITGVDHNGVYYLPKTVAIQDTNFESATINGTAITTNEYFSGKYNSDIGSYTVIAKDESGKSTTVTFEIKSLPEATVENADLIAEIRDDFETRYHEFPESTQNTLETQIRALEDTLAKIQDPDNSDNDLLAFRVNGQIGKSTIDEQNNTVTFVLSNSDLSTAKVPTLNIPKGASISPSANISQNFSTGVNYTITAIDGSVSTWTVQAIAPESDDSAPSLETHTVTNNVIMLEFDDYLDSSVNNWNNITLVHSTDSSLTQSVTSVTASGTALFIEFEKSLHDVESGTYTLNIPTNTFQNVSSVSNSAISISVEITNTKTEVSYLSENTEIFTITLNFNDSTMEDITYTTKTDGKLTYLPTGQSDCFEFKGWFTEKSGGTQVTIDTVFTQDMTIYAQWIETDDGNDGSDDNLDNTVEITTNSIDYAEGSAKVNYSLKGEIAEHGVSVGTTKESVENRTSKTLNVDIPHNTNGIWGTGTIDFSILLNYFTDETETLYVMMYAMDTEGNYVNGNVLTLNRSDDTPQEPSTCIITFNANSGTFPYLSTTIYENQPISSDFFDGSYPDPQRTGYTFNGWYTASTGGTKITASTVFSSNTTIYAQWTAIESDIVTYTVTFDGNDGEVDVETMETGSDFKLSSLPTPTLEGFIFDGWFTTKTGSTQVTTDYEFTRDRTIYAQWSKPTYTVKFDAMGGIDKAVYLTTDEDGYIDEFPTPTHETLFFDGWYLTQNGGAEAVTEDTVFTENTFLYARWKDATSYFGTYKNMIIAQNTRGSNYGGTVSSDNSNPMEGETVILTVSPTFRYSLLSISAKNSRGTTVSLKKISDYKYSFVQPADDLEITAIFEFQST